MREAAPQRRRDQHRKLRHALGCRQRHVERAGDVDVHRAVWAMLLDRAGRHDHHRIALKDLLELMPP